MRRVATKIAALAFLATAPVAAVAAMPSRVEASHCYKCVLVWSIPFHYECRTGGPEGMTANCTGGLTGCTMWGFCVD